METELDGDARRNILPHMNRCLRAFDLMIRSNLALLLYLSMASCISPVLCSSASLTPMAMSGLWEAMAIWTPQVLPSKPFSLESNPISLTTWRTRSSKFTKAVVVISSYLPEVMAISDRILVAKQGKVVVEFSATEATQEGIMYAAIH